MGRPPKAPQLKILNGTHRRDRHGDADAIMSESRISEVPPPPRDGTEFVLRWDGYCRGLIGAGVLTARDLGCLEMLCLAHEMLKKAEESIAEHGEYQRSARGAVMSHPALIRREAALTKILNFQSQLGLTPAARAKVAAVQGAATGTSKGVSKLRVEAK